MKILDKYKDYYDFLSHSSEADDSVFFDRRGSLLFYPMSSSESYGQATEKDIVKKAVNLGYDTAGIIIGLYAGYSLYLFKVHLILSTDISDPRLIALNDYNSQNYTYSIEYLGSRKNYERSHSDPILQFYRFTDNCSMMTKYSKHYKQPDFMTANLNNLNAKDIFKRESPFDSEKYKYRVPILKDTFISKFVHPEDIYYSIEEFISSKKNDIDVESKGLTDKEKAINHGFDAKTSFRNM